MTGVDLRPMVVLMIYNWIVNRLEFRDPSNLEVCVCDVEGNHKNEVSKQRIV